MEPSGRRRHLFAVGLALLILVTSLLPVPESAGDRVPTLLGVALDKWVHAVGYGVLTGLVSWAREPRTVGTAVVVVVAVVAYGGSVELLQGLVSSRSTSGADFAANTAGALVAGIAWLAVRRRAGHGD